MTADNGASVNVVSEKCQSLSDFVIWEYGFYQAF